MGRRKGKNDRRVKTFIGEGAFIDGSLQSGGIVRIEGVMKGQIESLALIIGENGEANIEVKARSVVIAGRMEGNIEAMERVEIAKTGVLVGNIQTARLTVEEGAVFCGSSQMPPQAKAQG